MPPRFTPNLSNLPAKSALVDSAKTVARRATGQGGGTTPELDEVVHKHAGEHFGVARGVKMLQYPKGVGVLDEYPHWLKIETHVRAMNSALMGTYSVRGEFVPPEAKAQAMDVNSAAARVGAIVGGTAGFNVAQAGAKALMAGKSGLSVAGKLLGTVVAPAAVGVAGALAGDVLARFSKFNGYMTLNSVMALGLQQAPSAQYDARWEAQDLGEIMATGEISPINIGRELLRNKAGIKGAGAEAAGLSPANVQAGFDLSSGKVKNPYKEQLFKGPEFRNFTFSFNFLPDSMEEAKTILAMIKLLRSTMLPALDPSGYYFIYPAEYTLTYMYRDDVNANVSAIGTCVLTQLNTKYGGQDFVTFRRPDSYGTPAEFAISMSFREIVPVTANSVMELNY